jgi:hypothetical protein
LQVVRFRRFSPRIFFRHRPILPVFKANFKRRARPNKKKVRDADFRRRREPFRFLFVQFSRSNRSNRRPRRVSSSNAVERPTSNRKRENAERQRQIANAKTPKRSPSGTVGPLDRPQRRARRVER